MEIALSRKSAAVSKAEEEASGEQLHNIDQTVFDEHFMDTPVDIEGFGRVWWTRESAFLLDSEQLLRLNKFNESQSDGTRIESKSLENGTFLVRLKK